MRCLGILLSLAVLFAAITPVAAQEASSETAAGSGAKPQAASPSQQVPEDKRVLGVLPNYRTANGLLPFEPITTKQKFTIFYKDSTDYPVFFTTGFFAGLGQLNGSDNSIYGQGVKGFAHRYGISYVDQVVGNLFPEAIVPSLFHEDPRYFRKGEGSFGSRFGYAISRIFVCKTDTGKTAFNAPELVGNSLASITALSYHVHERTFGDASAQFATYIATDTVGQIIKEFWPDIKRHMKKNHTN
jgi:hypothetical protein